MNRGSDDKTVRIWDSISGNLKNIFGGHLGKVYGLCYIGSGTILFSCSKVCAALGCLSLQHSAVLHRLRHHPVLLLKSVCSKWLSSFRFIVRSSS